jgi:hypothetical protein
VLMSLYYSAKFTGDVKRLCRDGRCVLVQNVNGLVPPFTDLRCSRSGGTFPLM